MKHKLLLTALSAALLLSTHTEAQIPGVSKVTKALPKIDLGIKLGANFQQLSGGSTWNSSYKGGVVGGAFFGVHKNKIGVQLEALVKSVKYTFGVSGSDIQTISLDVPLLLEYQVVSRLWIQAGPQYSTLISAKNSSSTDVKDYYKSSDVGGVLGVEARLPFHINAGARYILGFTDQNNNKLTGATDSWKNRSIQLYLGFRFL